MDKFGNLYSNFMQNHQVISNRSFDTYNIEWPEDSLMFKAPRPVGAAYSGQLGSAQGDNEHFPELMKLASGSSTWRLTASPDLRAGVLAGSLPGKATLPSPQDLITGSQLKSISWTAGLGATSHRVYFSINPIMSEADFKAEQTGMSYAVSLQAGTKYYWRIDEKNANGITKGFTWCFTTGSPYTATTVTNALATNALSSFFVSPNPVTSGLIHLMGQVSEPTSIKLELLNSIGQQVKQVEFRSEDCANLDYTLNALICKPGVYFLKMCTKYQVRTIPILITRE